MQGLTQEQGAWLRGVWAAALVALGCATAGEPSVAEEPVRELLQGLKARHDNLLMRCEPEDAEVFVNGLLRGPCTDFDGEPGGLQVGAGLHRIDVKRDGYWPHTTYHEPGKARAGLVVRLRPREEAVGGRR